MQEALGLLGDQRNIPTPTLERLAEYLRCLNEIQDPEQEFISSEELGRRTQNPAELVRRDLSYFGEFGRRGVGYNIVLLRHTIAGILGLNRPQGVILVGVGNLGRALLAYPGWRQYNLSIVAAFDIDPAKIGEKIAGVQVYSPQDLPAVVADYKARMGILAVPALAAQESANLMVSAGIRGILNFAPKPLEVPPYVTVRAVSFITELAVLSYLTGER